MRKLLLIAASLSVAGCAVDRAPLGHPSDIAPARPRPLEDAHNRLCEYYPLVILLDPLLARVPRSAEFVAAYHLECAPR